MIKDLIHRTFYFIFVLSWSACLHSMNTDDKASLQRGAVLFTNYCLGCHSLKYLRYEQVAKDLEIPLNLFKNNLIFTQAKITDPILIALNPAEAKKWFGVVPPDLSLSAKQRGEGRLYNYIVGFYTDIKRPFGVNNHVLANSAMPDVLESLKKGSAKEFEQQVRDLINFLSYASDPVYFKRIQLGPFVLLFLVLLFIPLYLLKRLYWFNK